MSSEHEASQSAAQEVGPVSVDLQPQEIPLDDERSRFRFNPSEKQFVATQCALEEFGPEVIGRCMNLLRQRADEHKGLDYLQVFTVGREQRKLWFIEDGEYITALLPSDY